MALMERLSSKRPGAPSPGATTQPINRTPTVTRPTSPRARITGSRTPGDRPTTGPSQQALANMSQRAQLARSLQGEGLEGPEADRLAGEMLAVLNSARGLINKLRTKGLL